MTTERAARAPSAAPAYLLLTATALLWAGNAVTSRWAPGHVSPQVITTLRWAVACAVLALALLALYVYLCILAVVYVLLTLAADVVNAWLDPRLRAQL